MTDTMVHNKIHSFLASERWENAFIGQQGNLNRSEIMQLLDIDIFWLRVIFPLKLQVNINTYRNFLWNC